MSFYTVILGALLLAGLVHCNMHHTSGGGGGGGGSHSVPDTGTPDASNTANGGMNVDHSTHAPAVSQTPVHSTYAPTDLPSTDALKTDVPATEKPPTDVPTTTSAIVTTTMTTAGYDVTSKTTAIPVVVTDPMLALVCQNLATVSCTDGLDIVCASDKQFYPNKCELTKARCNDPSLTLAETSTCIV